MTYKYLYQDRGNQNRSGEVKARNREEAYRLIRKMGIRPYRVIGDDPWNWRPWAVAVGYLLLFVVIGFLAMRLSEKSVSVKMTDEEARDFIERAISAVNNAPEAYRYNVWKGVNARLAERGLDPLPRPEGLVDDFPDAWSSSVFPDEK